MSPLIRVLKVLFVIPHNPIWIGSEKTSILNHPALFRKLLLFRDSFDKIIVFRGYYDKYISKKIKIEHYKNGYFLDKVIDVAIPYSNILFYSFRIIVITLSLLISIVLFFNKRIKIVFLFFDHTHIFTLVLRLFVKLFNIPIISFYVNTPINVKEYFCYLFSKLCDSFSLVNHPLISLRLRLKKFLVIPNIPDQEFFQDVDIRNRDKKTIIVVSRLTPEKRVELAIPVMNKLGKIFPETKLFVIGDGPLRKYLEKLAFKYNLLNKNIFFLGHRHLHEVLSIMKKAGFLLHFSRHEYFPNVIVEAMACNLPVITFAVPAYCWILGEAASIPLYPQNLEDIVKSIIYLSNDDKMYYNKVLYQKRRLQYIIDLYNKQIYLLKNYISKLINKGYV
ncbi:glycosyltransferase [Desulfurococcaceae archaeon MEX13E-LK6-19]|nr:glycosyltransferase [Desulfurococcaceae archaeon MEX13E-LK6-19]